MSTPDTTINPTIPTKSFSGHSRAPTGTVILNPNDYTERQQQLPDNNTNETNPDADPNPFEASNVITTDHIVNESSKTTPIHATSTINNNVNSNEDQKSKTKPSPSLLKSAMRPTVSGKSTP